MIFQPKDNELKEALQKVTSNQCQWLIDFTQVLLPQIYDPDLTFIERYQSQQLFLAYFKNA